MDMSETIVKDLKYIECKADIENAQSGDKDAMYNLYKNYSVAMLNVSYRILNNKEDAEDALQESFVKAFSRLNQFSFQSSFGAWIKRIVVNQSIDLLKKRRKLIFIDEEIIEEIDFEIESEVNLQEQLDALYKALHQLPDGYRTVLSLYLLEGYDHAEISEVLKIGVSTSISQLSRAKSKLKYIMING
jgi:RNA polymerase sigma-70 factor (ECF subfamily)